MRQATIFSRLVAAAGFVLLGAARVAAQVSWTDGIGGRYTGQLRGGLQPLPIITILRAEPNQPTAGEYFFIEPGGTRVDGALESCGIVTKLRLFCRWRDRHGEGTLDLIFATDTNSFTGRWSSTIKPNNWYPWTGIKTAPPGN